VSVAYAYQENRAGFQAGAALIRAQETPGAKHQAAAGETDADGLDRSAVRGFLFARVFAS